MLKSPVKLFFLLFLAAGLGGVSSLSVYFYFAQTKASFSSIADHQTESRQSTPLNADIIIPEGLNFLSAAQKVRPAVVHIKTSISSQKASYSGQSEVDDMLRQFHGDAPNRAFPQQSTGSGVIISDNGYIATNFHVIDQASQVEVVLNDKRSFIAEVIGSDPATDLALIKIGAEDLPFVPYGKANSVQIGEWVLAIGNPFDLTSTVTAGIVSAKGRSINLLKDQYAIESFIQTDAAVNPGNSGGALVNLNGELIGVNTAIATQTGYYTGYSFAVPIDLVSKVMDDLMNYGETQRAILGISIQEVDAKMAKRLNLKKIRGVLVAAVTESGAAQKAGIRPGDVIQTIDDRAVNSPSELQTAIATHHPGESVRVKLNRKGSLKSYTVVLRNTEGNIKKVKKVSLKILGAEMEELSIADKQLLGLSQGVKVTRIEEGALQQSGMQESFIITKVDDIRIYSLPQLEKLLKDQNHTIAIDGQYPDGHKDYYAIGW